MYEVWASERDPEFLIVQQAGKTRLSFDPLEWTQLGTTDQIDALLLEEIRGIGFAAVRLADVLSESDEDVGQP